MNSPHTRWFSLLVAAWVITGLPDRLLGADEIPLRQRIDAEVRAAWQGAKLTPAAPADDAAFLRRVCLDLIGTIPTYEETTQFLADTAADKRARLIDRLLDDPRYGVHQADVWLDVFFDSHANNQDVARGREVFHRWLTEKFAKNEPYDRWARELLLAEGNTAEHGPPLFYAQFSAKPEETAVAVSRIFLGTQLQCAQCHDHPNDKWKQVDFYGLAGFFARLVVIDQGMMKNQRKLIVAEKSTGDVLFAGPKPKIGDKGKPVAARFLGGDLLSEPQLPKDFKEADFKSNKNPPKPVFSRKEKLADWIVAAENPYFTKAVVNRVWGQYLGRGLVHPVDNLRIDKEASHPQLFLALEKEFGAHKYDLKWLIRELVSSQTYQLGAVKGVTESELYEQYRVRPLTGTEMLTALREATGFDAAARADGKKPEEVKLPGQLKERIERHFGDAMDGRGDFQASLTERLFMNNSQEIRQLIQRRKGNLMDTVLASPGPWEEKVDRLYLTVLNRPPTPEQRQRLVDYLKADSNKPDMLLEEAIWALINCSEFRFNH
jgi:hypothetical protein